MKMFPFLILVGLISSINALYVQPGIPEFGDEKFTGRIVDIEEFPYQVSISDHDGFWCGGSILSPYHVLSAGHCARIGKPPLVVRAGSSYYSHGGSVHYVERNVTYDNLTNYDVAVLYLRQPIVLDKTRRPIELVAAGDEPEAGLLTVLTGWGVTNPRASPQLRVVDIPIADRAACNKFYNGTDVSSVTEGQICAGYFDQRQENTCHVESGAPLTINGKQVGISSLGLECAVKYAPDVYADIAYFSDWIKKQMAVDS